MIRVGLCGCGYGTSENPSYPGFTPIGVSTTSRNKYRQLSPFILKDKQGRIMENIWQFSKVYESVPKITQRKSRYDNVIIWSHPKEQHVDIDNNEILPEYWGWRRKGMNNPYAVRNPVGIKNRGKCLYAIKSGDFDKKLDYIEARKQIY